MTALLSISLSTANLKESNMKRIAITEEPGLWFDKDKSICFDDSTYWNGNNHISRATGSPWERQRLYYTANGKWVINCWSHSQGSDETYEQVDEGLAVDWLVKHDHADSSDLPKSVQYRVNEQISQREI